jgi:hypothetical protein
MASANAGPVGASADLKEIAVFSIVGLGALGLAYYALRPKDGGCWFYDVQCQASKLGHDAVQNTYNYVVSQTERDGGLLTPLNTFLTTERAKAQGSPINFVSVPPTPAGFTSSNWTWKTNSPTFDDGTGPASDISPISVGLPAGQTLLEFCERSPGAGAICNNVVTKKQGIDLVGALGSAAGATFTWFFPTVEVPQLG